MSFTIATFNVNGLRARLPIVLDWLAANQPQVLCLQETKVQDPDFPLEPLQKAGYQAVFWGQKSYNGVALLSQEPAADLFRGFSENASEDQARLIAARFGEIWVLNTYVPQGQEVGAPAFEAKLEFLASVKDLLARRFTPQTPLVWLGDLNVAPGPLDVYDPQRLAGKVCFHPDEQAALTKVLDWGLTDLFRHLHPEEKQFTFWDYRLPKALDRDLGWRIDHIMSTQPLTSKCSQCWVDTQPRRQPKPSDHTPLAASFDL